jgi:hypothetical protein
MVAGFWLLASRLHTVLVREMHELVMSLHYLHGGLARRFEVEA